MSEFLVITFPSMEQTHKPEEKRNICSQCYKVAEACMCDLISQITPKTQVLILQHPQEARHPLTTARMISLTFPNAVHAIGLSWRSFSQALGEKKDPKRWAVLYLGTQKSSKKWKDAPFQIIDKLEQPVSPKSIEGIVLLDGNWKQSKTLWWRNAWLLKMHRIILNPETRSAYNAIRKEPRGNCLSTIEAAAETLKYLEPNTKPSQKLLEVFEKYLEIQKSLK